MARVATLVLRAATVYASPARAPIRDASILIGEGVVQRVGARVRPVAAAKALDCTGCTVVAGFWNAHVHFHERKWADAGKTAGSSTH